MIPPSLFCPGRTCDRLGLLISIVFKSSPRMQATACIGQKEVVG